MKELQRISRLLDESIGPGYDTALVGDLDNLRWLLPQFAEELEVVLGKDNQVSRDEMELFLHVVRSNLRGYISGLLRDVCDGIDKAIGPDE